MNAGHPSIALDLEVLEDIEAPREWSTAEVVSAAGIAFIGGALLGLAIAT